MPHSYWPVHAHSRYSWLDGMPSVEQMVAKVVEHRQPALALTDHGVMSGIVRLYKECKREGISPFPGCELYVVRSLDKGEDRYHTGMLALDLKGYEAMVRLNNMAFDADHFHYKPRITYAELKRFGKENGKHVALTTGCYFSLVVQALVKKGPMQADALVRGLAAAFPNLYVEVQNHNTKHDDGFDDATIADSLFKIASLHGLPIVIGQDSHYCDKDDRVAHTMMKQLGYKGAATGDDFFPGDSYHLASTKWIKKHWSDEIWRAADDGHDDLLGKNRLRIPALEKYQFLVPEIYAGHGVSELRRRVKRGMETFGFDRWSHYEARCKYELGVIEEMGFGNYFLMTDDVVSKARKRGILVNVRGSANGSLILYAFGITNVDPIKWDISFDRFLHPSRKKPPDIDMDIDRDRRPEFIEILSDQHKVVPIGTYGTLTDSEDRGAIFVKYVSWRNSIGKPVDIEYLRDLEQIAPDDMPALRMLADMRVLTGGGTHAAGYIIDNDKQPIERFLPMMKVGGKNGNTVTQFEDDDCEEFGYVKFDALGAAALTTVAMCLTLIGKDPVHGLGWIKDDDTEACKLLRTGMTGTGLFQFEGYSTAKGARQMGVKSTKDAILALALFRPAAMNGGHTDEYLLHRKGKAKATYLHDVFKSATKDTYGVFVLQDQVIDVLRSLGMSHEDLNDMLKAVKMSNHNVVVAEQTFARIRPVFLRLCVDVGMDGPTAKKAWEKVMGFSDYGFNKAHATSYGLLAYRMAWLKAYHPKEFMASLLATWAGKPKEREYLGEARRMGLRIGKADVNLSDLNWTLDEKGLLRRGLLSVKGLGLKSAAELASNRPYESMNDLIERCDGGPGMVTGGKSWKKDGTLNGVLGSLRDAGALRSVLEQEDE